MTSSRSKILARRCCAASSRWLAVGRRLRRLPRVLLPNGAWVRRPPRDRARRKAKGAASVPAGGVNDADPEPAGREAEQSPTSPRAPEFDPEESARRRTLQEQLDRLLGESSNKPLKEELAGQLSTRPDEVARVIAFGEIGGVLGALARADTTLWSRWGRKHPEVIVRLLELTLPVLYYAEAGAKLQRALGENLDVLELRSESETGAELEFASALGIDPDYEFDGNVLVGKRRIPPPPDGGFDVLGAHALRDIVKQALSELPLPHLDESTIDQVLDWAYQKCAGKESVQSLLEKDLRTEAGRKQLRDSLEILEDEGERPYYMLLVANSTSPRWRSIIKGLRAELSWLVLGRLGKPAKNEVTEFKRIVGRLKRIYRRREKG